MKIGENQKDLTRRHRTRNHRTREHRTGPFHRQRIGAALGALATLALLSGQAAMGQGGLPSRTLSFTSYLYTMKFACGGASLLRDEQSLEDPVALPYEDFAPGRYATAFNFFNAGGAARNVTVSVAAEGLGPNLAVASFSLAPFETRRVGCLTIMNRIRQVWPSPLDGQLIEGFAYVIQNSDGVDVEAIYSYAFLADGFGTAFEQAASGEGVGASLDVVKILPREIDGPILIPAPTP